MNFVSANYAALLGLSFLLYWLLPSRRARLIVLIGGSYLFYMAWSQKLVALLWFSTILDFICGQRIADVEDPRRKKHWLWVSLAGNLSVLGLFKYYGFFIDSANGLLAAMGFDPLGWRLNLVLPLGISFYTFQTLSYTIDIYRGQMKPTRSLLEFALFISFFPQLVAGPIVRARDFLPQTTTLKRFDITEIQWGLERILWGLIKKAVVADNLAQIVEHLFANAAGTTSTHAWMAVIAFYGQVYCDFSGYSDIAIGSSRLFGFKIKENFNKPYLTGSPQEYWNHWHISLSTWLRDYVYFPLGGNRKGPVRTYCNLFATMFVSGIWHGAAWTFVIWGAYHGICLGVHRMWSRAGYRLPYAAGLFGQVLFTCVGYFMFRAESWQNMVDIMTAAAAIPTTALEPMEWAALGWCAAIFGLEPFDARLRKYTSNTQAGAVLRGVLVGLGITLLMLAKAEVTPDFVYFVF